jgi:c-di-GMP-binding flagellar brake protein YcgR
MSVLDHLKNFKIVRILLPVGGSEPLPLECVARMTSAPFCDVVFLAGQLPGARLDPAGECKVFFEVEGRPHSMTARIVQIVDENKLRLQAVEYSGFAHHREYFRVDTEISLTFRRLKEGRDGRDHSLSAPVSLSGGGVFFPIREDIQVKEKLALVLFLRPESGWTVSAIGQVMRLSTLGRDRTGVGLKFVEIEPQERDKVISFCLAEQRRMLQTRVRILDQD